MIFQIQTHKNATDKKLQRQLKRNTDIISDRYRRTIN